MDNRLDIKKQDDNIIATELFHHKTLEERALEFEGKIGPYEEFEWDKSVGREYVFEREK